MAWEILFSDFCPRKYRFKWQNVIMFRRPGVSPFRSVKIPVTINWLVQPSFSHHQFHDQYTSRATPSGVLQWWNLLSYQPVEIFWCNTKMVPKIWQTLQTPGSPLRSRMSKSTNPSGKPWQVLRGVMDGNLSDFHEYAYIIGSMGLVYLPTCTTQISHM